MGAVSTEPTEDELCHLYAVFYGDMQLCGCNVPDMAWEEIRWMLQQCPLYDGTWAEVERRYGGAGAAHIMLGSIDNAGLIEHGGTIAGSWITGKGQWVLDTLNRVNGPIDEALDHVGFPHDRGKCPLDCPIGQSW